MRVSPRTFPGVLHPQNYTAVDWFVKDLILWFHVARSRTRICILLFFMRRREVTLSSNNELLRNQTTQPSDEEPRLDQPLINV